MSAPVARMAGRWQKPAGNVMASGTKPRARRSMAPSRSITESSIRCRMSRLWSRKPSAISASCSSACELVMAGGLPLRLPEVITSGRCVSCISKCCSGLAGSITPMVSRPGAMSSGKVGSHALGISTMGAAGERSRACTACGRPSALGIITASGFPGRCLRVRSVATACGLSASQAR